MVVAAQEDNEGGDLGVDAIRSRKAMRVQETSPDRNSEISRSGLGGGRCAYKASVY
jgi:hypothetical protein